MIYIQKIGSIWFGHAQSESYSMGCNQLWLLCCAFIENDWIQLSEGTLRVFIGCTVLIKSYEQLSEKIQLAAQKYLLSFIGSKF